jgi:hypothetical protein
MPNPPNAWRLTRNGKASTLKHAIANHRRIEELIRQMRELSQRVLLHSAPNPKRPTLKASKTSLT